MKLSFINDSSFWKKMILLLIIFSCLIRFKVFLENRSLFIDEANLGRNIVERNVMGFFSPLGYEQYAPPLFMVETKLLTQIFGDKDWVLRIIPLVGGLISIFIFWLILKHERKPDLLILFGLGLFCFSPDIIRYHTEFKPYGGDVLLTALMIWFALNDDRFDRGEMIFWTLLGMLAIWYSNVMVFVLPGVFFYLLTKFRAPLLAVSGFGWACSLLLYYVLVLQYDVSDTNLQDHFHADFFQLSSISGVSIMHNLEQLQELVKLTMDKTALGIAFGGFCLIAGLIALRKDPPKLLLLVTPLILMIIASAMHRYPIVPRLILFTIPILILLMVEGLTMIWKLAFAELKLALCLLSLICLVNKGGYEYIYKPISDEKMKEIITILDETRATDETIYVHHEAAPSFTFYNNLQEVPTGLNNYQLMKWDTKLSSALKDKAEVSWLIFSHASEDSRLNYLKDIESTHDVKEMYRFERAAVYRLSLKNY